jgi:hypothetical protein
VRRSAPKLESFVSAPSIPGCSTSSRRVASTPPSI